MGDVTFHCKWKPKKRGTRKRLWVMPPFFYGIYSFLYYSFKLRLHKFSQKINNLAENSSTSLAF